MEGPSRYSVSSTGSRPHIGKVNMTKCNIGKYAATKMADIACTPVISVVYVVKFGMSVCNEMFMKFSPSEFLPHILDTELPDFISGAALMCYKSTISPLLASALACLSVCLSVHLHVSTKHVSRQNLACNQQKSAKILSIYL